MNFQKPRGTQDILPQEAKRWQFLEKQIHIFTKRFGYEEIRTPIFEHTEVFKRENDSSDIVNKEMYTFMMNKTSLTLRPEQTASILRSYVENKMYANDLPQKLFYIGPQFRHERPQKGRQRQFHQFGVECIGAKSPYLDAECITLGYELLKHLGIQNLKVKINTLGDKASRDAYRSALVSHFEKEKALLCEDCNRRLLQNPLRVLDCKIDQHLAIMKTAPIILDYLTQESKTYFNQVLVSLDALSIPYEIDEKLVRGLDYYCETVFEVVSTDDTLGSQSTIFGGGRYENLAEYFGGPKTEAVGFGMGMERVLLAMPQLQIESSIDAYVLCLDASLQTKAFVLVQQLRQQGLNVQGDYFARSFKAQFKSVDKLNAKFAIILGKKEDENNSVVIKNIATQTQEIISIDNVASYLKGENT